MPTVHLVYANPVLADALPERTLPDLRALVSLHRQQFRIRAQTSSTLITVAALTPVSFQTPAGHLQHGTTTAFRYAVLGLS